MFDFLHTGYFVQRPRTLCLVGTIEEMGHNDAILIFFRLEF